MAERFRCKVCRQAELVSEDASYLLAKQIDRAFVCPECKTLHFLLKDRVLCTAEDFDKRIRSNYEAGKG